jgi:NAD(P)-dependent dehydrogenase (short-subunit alcohol dehydrogenase family)
MLLNDRVAVVTGSGRAIGKTIALRLAAEGAHIVLAERNSDDLAEAAKSVAALGRQVLPIVTDVTSEHDVGAMASRVQEQFGALDILVNNAAIIGPTVPVHEVRRDDWDEVLAVNLTGAMLCARAVLPGMIARRAGKIINIASVAGKIAYPLRSPYAVSKWGLIGLTMTLAQEVGPFGIQVNVVCPGPVEGDRMRTIIATRARELGHTHEEVERDYLAKMALGRMVRAGDVASLVAYLASPHGDNITGQAIDVSAGYRL